VNIYVVTEGNTEKIVYNKWIPQINDSLTPADSIFEITDNNFYIVSGRGYPQYFDTVENAIQDVNDNEEFDRLVICIDSENMTLQEKRDEVESFVHSFPCRVDTKIIIQHFCFEAWALGNKQVVRTRPRSTVLEAYKAIYNVRAHDPEDLPDHSRKSLSRVEFAKKYLNEAFLDKYRKAYRKSNPEPIQNKKYFQQLNSRFDKTGHIASFSEFISAFS
jgi:hypothetical protein